MRAGVWAAAVAVSILGQGTVWAACAPSQSRNCVVNLGLVPQISRDIVGAEPIPAAPTRLPALETRAPYTGPTVGAVPNLRRAPEIGYRWAIN